MRGWLPQSATFLSCIKYTGIVKYSSVRCPHSTLGIILDESHILKSTTTKQSSACFRLTSKYRWCVTGTPVNNTLLDMYGQLKFLQADAFHEATYRKMVRCAPDLLCQLLSHMVMRHTASQQFNGKSILELPTKTHHELVVRFTTGQLIIGLLASVTGFCRREKPV